MLPTLEEGDFILVRRVRRHQVSSLELGTIVCLQHPHFGFMTKRLLALDDDGTVRVGSDGQTGSDSSALGPVPIHCITHRLLWRIPR
ncbi:MAG: hypothetical protein AB8F65_06530 [Woeseiaceae bacterium]